MSPNIATQCFPGPLLLSVLYTTANLDLPNFNKSLISKSSK